MINEIKNNISKQIRPPRFAEWLLRRITKSQEKFSVLGDYEEEFFTIAEDEGLKAGKSWYWKQTLNSIIPFISRLSCWRFTMVGNYFKIAFRNIKKHKGYSFINITGLAIGMACCVLLVLYIHAELNFDGYHEKKDRIFRLCAYINIGGSENLTSASNAVAAEVLRDEYPEVENAARFRWMPASAVRYGDNLFFENSMFYADESAFDIFTWPVIKGDSKTALIAPYSIVISEELAEKYFGKEEPLGKVLRFNEDEEYTVRGVMRNIPDNSYYQFDALTSMSTYYQQAGSDSPILTDWVSYNFLTFLLLREGIDYHIVNEKIKDLLYKYAGDDLKAKGAEEELFLQPLKDMYLRPLGRAGGPIFYVYIFSVIAVFVLLIACVNFMNLSTARSANRAREVGMRKVLGAERRRLIGQFLSEAMFFSFLSLIFALILAHIVLPPIRTLTGRNLSMNIMEIPWLIPSLIGLAVIVGIVAGSYPAFFLTRFQPVTVMKGELRSGSSNKRLRRTLVIFQFTISIALIIGTGLIINQLDYMKNRDPGFDKEHIAILRLTDDRVRQMLPVFKESFKSFPKVMEVAAASSIPGWGSAINDKIPEGYTVEQTQLMDDFNADEDFIPTLGIEIIAGRNFSKAFGADNRQSVIINETAAKQFGWKEPIGKTIRSINPNDVGTWIPKTVIGVVKDFHMRGLSRMINPLFLDCEPDFPFEYKKLRLMLVRIAPGDIVDTMNFLENKWEEIVPHKPFEYFFLDESFDRQFRSIERSRSIFSYFSFLAIFIACLGLFGMASFTAEQRTKEIGIRKVLGSSSSGIVFLLSKELLILVAAANVFAWPIAYLWLKDWLQGFPYRVSITIFPFVVSALLVAFISFITIAYQAIRAALANPVDALRYE